MAASTSLLFALFLSIIFSSSSSSSLFSPANVIVTDNNVNGFKINLIHRDSPQSPLFNPNFTLSDRIKAAKMRSLARHHLRPQHYFSSPDDLTGSIKYASGEDLIQYSIGTPPLETYAIIDTGSDLPWLQCLPCEKCYRQMGPYYDSTKSSSYENVKCNTSGCDAVNGVCYGVGDKCRFQLDYQDGSYTGGYLSHETLVFMDTKNGQPCPLYKMIFGCGVINTDTPGVREPGMPGILGLNLGQLSFIRQISFEHFAYCFIPDNNKVATSAMTFGLSAIFEGVRAPLKYYEGRDDYYLNLVGISVGNDSLQIPPGAFDVQEDGQGGFYIDSGSTFTVLHSVLYENILAEVKKKTPYDSIQRDATGTFDLCYDVNMIDIEFGAPAITLHFYGGTDLVLKGINAWTDNGYGLICLAMIRSGEEYQHSILGNHQQQNIYVGYNLKERYLIFKPTDCTKI